jgi:excinuclease ABC subunit C
MVHSASKVDFQQTDTLLEAVILEANLIKKYWPKYNVEEKDDKSFIYLVVTVHDEWPKPLVIRGRELERYKEVNAEIFGPYQSYRILRTVMELLRPIFPYSTCQPGQLRPCFHYQIGLCPGVCIDKADKAFYRRSIRNLVLFMRGDKKRLLKTLKKENPEKAKALQHVQDVSLLAESDLSLKGSSGIMSRRIEGYDISHLSGKEPVGAMVVFENAEKDPSQYRLFKIHGEARDDLGMLKEVMERRLKHPEWPMPDLLFVDGGLLQAKVMRDVLKQHKLFIPVIGLSKGGLHAGSAHSTDKLVALNVKKVGKEVLLSSKRLFQEVRNEAHRFANGFGRKRQKKSSLIWRHSLK